MLEKDFVGQRSGTRNVCGFAVSQNQRKVRRSRSSIDDGGVTALLLGASAVVSQEAPRRRSSAANAADVRRTCLLEVHFQADLFASAEAHDATRLTKSRRID